MPAPTVQELHALIGSQESSTLEFKAGAALTRQNDNLNELIKDVSGMANAAGGRLIYGIGERRERGRPSVAERFVPVIDPTITSDWIAQVLKSRSNPPLQRFDIWEVDWPETEDGGPGRILVVDIVQAGTAHQAHDRRYYQRNGSTTEAMVDFQIRDVMGRRSSPHIDVQINRRTLEQRADLHRYEFVPVLANVGLLTLKEWLLELDIPYDIDADNAYGPERARGRRNWTVRMEAGRHAVRYHFAPAYLPSGEAAGLLYPTQTVDMSEAGALPIRTMLTKAAYDEMRGVQRAIPWRLFMTDALPIFGELSFAEWCNF